MEVWANRPATRRATLRAESSASRSSLVSLRDLVLLAVGAHRVDEPCAQQRAVLLLGGQVVEVDTFKPDIDARWLLVPRGGNRVGKRVSHCCNTLELHSSATNVGRIRDLPSLFVDLLLQGVLNNLP